MILIFYLLCQNLLPRSFLMEPRTGFPFESSFCSYPCWPCFLCRIWRTLERKLSLPSSALRARNAGYRAQRTHEMGRGLTAKVHSVPVDSSNTSKTTFWKEFLQKKKILPLEITKGILSLAPGYSNWKYQTSSFFSPPPWNYGGKPGKLSPPPGKKISVLEKSVCADWVAASRCAPLGDRILVWNKPRAWVSEVFQR